MTFAVWKTPTAADIECTPNPWVGVAPEVGVIGFLDSFTDTNLVLLVNHAADIEPAGTAWVALIGADATFIIFNNEARVSDVGSRTLIAHDTGLANFVFTFKIDLDLAAEAAIYFRVKDLDDFWVLDVSNSGGGVWQLIKSVGGVETVEASAAATGVTGGVVSYQVTANGTSILVEDLTNTLQLSTIDSDHENETFIGMGEAPAGTSVPLTIDDFRVDSIVE